MQQQPNIMIPNDSGIMMFPVPLHVMYALQAAEKERYLVKVRAKGCHQNKINNAVYSYDQALKRFAQADEKFQRNPPRPMGACNFHRLTGDEMDAVHLASSANAATVVTPPPLSLLSTSS